MSLLLLPYFSLFLIIILGFLLGEIKIKGISLDISAILFVSMVFGYYGVEFPESFKYIGLVLFIFTIGFQAGPSFFETFKKEGKKLAILSFVIVFSGALVSVICAKIFGFSKELTAGLFTGALTSTPGLAAISEISNSKDVAIAYGIAYPFGVIGVVLFIKIFPKIFGFNIADAEKRKQNEIIKNKPLVINRNYIVENPLIFDKTLSEISFRQKTGATVSRVLQNGNAFTPSADTVLTKSTIIKAVGTEEAHEKVLNLIGKSTLIGVSLNKTHDVKFITVTNKKVLNKTINQLQLSCKYHIIITRIRRSGIDLSANSNIKLQFGDKLKVAGSKEDISKITELLGNDSDKVYASNYIPISLGIVLGVLLGSINIKLGNIDFSLGLTGGVMIIAIILSRIRKIGPLVFSLTIPANKIFRQIGLILFLSAVGTEAGANIVSTLKVDGLQMLLSGLAITIIPMILSVVVAKYILKIDVLSLLGAITGGMTSTPGLAAANSATKTNAPSIAYATIYPIAMILVVVCVQIIFWI